METINLDDKDNHLVNNNFDKIDPISLNINESLIMKNNNLFNDNISLKEKNEVNEKEFNIINFFQSFEEGEDRKNVIESLRSERETLSNSKKIMSNDLNKLNEEEMKKQLKLKRNRESAKDGRLRKKEYIQNLINENNYLKIKNKNLLNIICQCPKCMENYEKNQENNDTLNYECEDNLLKDANNNSNKKKFLFATILAVISIINIFNIPFNIMNYYNIFYNGKIEYLRNLNNFNQNYTLEERYNNENNYIINKLSTPNGDNEALFIHLAEFYSLTKRKKIGNQNKVEEEINKNIQIFHENQINIDQLSQTNATKCVKCVVEINRNSVKIGGDELTFYLADRYLTTFFGNTSEDGVFPDLNFNEAKKKSSKSFSKILALKCKILGYSINDLFSEKI